MLQFLLMLLSLGSIRKLSENSSASKRSEKEPEILGDEKVTDVADVEPETDTSEPEVAKPEAPAPEKTVVQSAPKQPVVKSTPDSVSEPKETTDAATPTAPQPRDVHQPAPSSAGNGNHSPASPNVEIITPRPVETPDTPQEEPSSQDPVIVTNNPIIASEDAIEVSGGRVTTLELEESETIDAVRVLTQPDFGRVTVNPDNTLALVLTGTKDAGNITFDYAVRDVDGNVESHTMTLTVTEPTQAAGWGLGDHYLLEEDSDGNSIIERGDDSRDIYVSNSSKALSAAEIAKIEGVKVADITTEWLIEHPEYGGSEDKALTPELGMNLWYETTATGDKETSNWLLFEKGYTYQDLGRIIGRGASGEDELHPLHITSFGSGEKPVLDSTLWIFQEDSTNVVFSDITLSEGVYAMNGSNILFENVSFEDDEVNMQGVSNVTIRHSEFTDITENAPHGGGDTWEDPWADRISGLYGTKLNGLLLEGNLWDHNAWEAGYDGAEGGQPPSMLSHNIYLQPSAIDTTFTDNITMRAASFGAQFRGGVHADDNVFLDNNAALVFVGGNYKGAGYIGNYTYLSDSVVTSGAHKEADHIGAYTQGIKADGHETTLLNNIVAHLADPNNEAEFNEKYWGNFGLKNYQDTAYDNTTIYNWSSSRNHDFDDLWSEGLNGQTAQELNQITIQKYTEQLLGKPNATIDDLAKYLRSLDTNDSSSIAEATDSIIDFFQSGFGTQPTTSQSAYVQFTPSDIADGVRWDTDVNWTGGEAPEFGDSVALGGNWVKYGAAGTNTISNLDMGREGTLDITSGKLTVLDDLMLINEASINIEKSGQLWVDNYADSDKLNLDLDGGRFANTGHMHGNLDIVATDGELLLGAGDALFDLTADSKIDIQGTDAKVGFDGDSDDIAALRMEEGAQIKFTADATGFSAIKEFQSGAYKDGADVQSGVNLGDATLEVNVAKLESSEGLHTLIEADKLIGAFGDINITGLNNRDAEIIIDYDNNSAALKITSGTGKVSSKTKGDEATASETDTSLWNALTKGFGTYDDRAEAPDEFETTSEEYWI